MNHRMSRTLVIGTIAAVPFMAQAETLAGIERFLCTSTEVTRCEAFRGCDSGPPSLWNMPPAIQVDLAKKTLSTPPNSGQQRHSPFTHLARADGRIFIQGMENDRVFSLVIAEDTGLASMALALDGTTISVFGACTPLPKT
jgi:hypothetical protein